MNHNEAMWILSSRPLAFGDERQIAALAYLERLAAMREGEEECPECDGTGLVECECSECGDVHEKECVRCDGTGGGFTEKSRPHFDGQLWLFPEMFAWADDASMRNVH